MSDGWLETTGTEFGEVDNPDYPGNTKAPWDTTEWNKGAWGDDISGWHTQGVALPNVPRGTRVEVRNPQTGETTVTEVKDKGPGQSTGAGIDILPGTGSAIGLPTNYKGPLEYKVLGGGAFDQYQDTPDKTKISELPEHLDLSDWDQPHRAFEPEPQETVPAPPVARSLIQEFHDQNPTITTSDQGILAEMRQAWAPEMPEEEFKVAATTPGGRDRIRDWQERQKNPLEQVRDQHPEWSNYSDDKLIKTLYSEWTKNGQLDAGKMTLAQFRDRMRPATDWQNQYARLVEQAKAEFLPKSAGVGVWALTGLQEQSLRQAEPTIREILAKTYSPDVNLDDVIKHYSKMTPQERTKEFAEANAQFMRDDDSARLLDQVNASFEVLGKSEQLQESIAWMKKAMVTLDAPGPYQLPADQEKWVDTIVKLPAQAVMAVAPGFREFGLLGTLYADNTKAIEQNNPGMDSKEVARRAETATMQAFPGNELLQFSFLRGGPEIQGTIINRIRSIGLELGKEAGLGAGVGGANQVITNIAAGRDPLFGVGESAGTMATLGLAGRTVGLTVEGLTRAQTHVPEIRRATGISADIVGATPEEANKIVRGDPTAEVNVKATRNSIDLILSAHAQREAEKGNVPAWQVRREAEIAGRVEEGRPKVPAAPEVVPAERTVTPGAETTGTLYGAYQRLVQKTGLSSVKLSDLAKELGLSASELKRVLKEVHPENIELSGTNIPEAEYPAEEKTFWIERKGTEPADKVRLYPGPAETAQPPERTASQEAFDKARTALDKGDVETAKKQINKGIALSKNREDIQKKTADGLKGVTRKNSNAKAENVEGYYGTNDPPGKVKRGVKPPGKRGQMGAAFNPFGGRRKRTAGETARMEKQYQRFINNTGLEDTPERRADFEKDWDETFAETARVRASEKTRPKATPEKKGDPIKSALDAVGLEDTPENRARMQGYAEGTEEAEAFSGISLSFIRKTAQWFRNIDQFKGFFDSVSRTTAPERRGEIAEATGAVVKDTSVAMDIYRGLKAIAEDMDMHKLFRNGDESARRDAKITGQYSDSEIAAMQAAKERGEKLSDPIMDKLFDYWRACYDWLEEIGRDNGIEFGHLANFFHHAFNNPPGEVDATIKGWEPRFGKQAFQKTRHYPNIQDAIDAGLTPKTYSPERNLMSYAAQMITAIRQVQALKVMAEEGLAIPIEDAREQGLTKPKDYTLYTAADGQSYYVSDQAHGVLANAFDLNSIYNTMAGPFVAFARTFKAATGLKLSWSAFHAVHIVGIMQSETLANMAQRGLQGTGTAKDFWDGLMAEVTFGMAPTIRALRKYADVVDVMTTGKGWDKLTDQGKTDIVDAQEMGLSPYISDERRVTFADMIFRGSKSAAGLRDIAELGYYWLRMEPLQEWIFGKLVPRLKVAAALARRDTLIQKYGEAFRSPENRMKRLLEYQKINRDVEGRFGEIFYDNLLWKKQAKQLGTAVPLSLGWSLGFWRVYGDGIVDLMDNVAHIDQIAKWAVTGGKEGRVPNLSNRLIYATNYTMMSMLACKLASMALAGPASTASQELMDWFFPRIGRKPNGDDERVRTPFWTGEWASLGEHFLENTYKNQPWETAGVNAFSTYFGNKLNPGLAAIYHFFSNRDFMGRDIFDGRDPLGKQLLDRTSRFLSDLLMPISAEDVMTDVHGLPNEPKQVIASFFGFTQAPASTTRTPLQNEIATMFHDQFQRHTTKRENDIFDAKTRYQYGINAGDRQMQAESLARLHELGAGPRLIEDARKNAKVPPAHRAYKGLTEDRQVYLLRHMSPAEYHEYWPLTKAQAKMEYVRSQ